jgi:hypothetical protein
VILKKKVPKSLKKIPKKNVNNKKKSFFFGSRSTFPASKFKAGIPPQRDEVSPEGGHPT